jgi:hypothetical protein
VESPRCCTTRASVSQPWGHIGATSLPSGKDNYGYQRSGNAAAQQPFPTSITGCPTTPVFSRTEEVSSAAREALRVTGQLSKPTVLPTGVTPRRRGREQCPEPVFEISVAQPPLSEGCETVSGMGHLLGYARVSTTDQHPQLQVDALQRAGCYQVFTLTPRPEAMAAAVGKPIGRSPGLGRARLDAAHQPKWQTASDRDGPLLTVAM